MRRLLLTVLALLCPALLSAQTLDSVKTDSVGVQHYDITQRLFYTKTVTKTDTLWRDPTPVLIATKVLTGEQNLFDSRSSPLPAGSLVDARTATWTGAGPYVLTWSAGSKSRWVGGTVKGTWNPTTTLWDIYHSTYALAAHGPNLTVEGLRATNIGDGARFNDAKDWTLKDAWFTDIHDDCFENDKLTSGVVDGMLCDGAYNGISVRPGASGLSSVNGSKDSVVIRNSLIRLEKKALTYSAPNTHGGFIKAENREPDKNLDLIYENNVFRADGLPAVGTLCLNPHGMVRRSSRNVMVWLGAGDYPCAMPPGWTITRDVKVWDTAVAAWKARH